MNKSSSRHSPQETRRLREGAEWLIRLSVGASDGEALSDEELAAWIQWYEMDPDNALAFEEMQSLWGHLGQLQTPGMPAQVAGQKQWQRKVLSSRKPSVGTGSALREFLVRFRLFDSVNRKTFAWGRLIATGALGISVGVWAFLALVMAPGPLELPRDGTMGTALAENREAVLPDGSTVALGAQSTLALEYAPSARNLKLTSGQAYFNVAKDKTRPFAVDTGYITIRAVGTAFDVRRNEGRVAVTVTEGMVDIITDQTSFKTANGAGDAVGSDLEVGQNQRAPIRVAAGYQLIWDEGSPDKGRQGGRKQILQLSQVDTTSMIAWREGRLEYVNEPLSVVIANVNRYSSRRLVIESVDLGSLNFTGTILVNSIDDWLTAIQIAFPVSVRAGEGGSLIIRRRPSGSAATSSAIGLSI